MKKQLYFLILSIWLLAACNFSDSRTDPSLLTQRDYLHFAKEIEKAVSTGHGDFIDKHFNMDAFMGKIDSMHTSAGFKTGVKIGIKASFSLGEKFDEVVKNGGSYHFLGLKTMPHGPVAVFRMLTSDGGVNYHEYQLTANMDKEPVINDIFIWTSGENITETIERTVLTSTSADPDNNSIDDVRMQKVKDFVNALAANNPAEIDRLYQMLPPDIQKQRSYMVLHIIALQQLSKDRYVEALDQYNRQYPKDGSMALMMIDKYYDEGNYTKAIDCINIIDSLVGGDPYQNVMRASMYSLMGDRAQGIAFVKKAIAQEPNLQPANRLLYFFNIGDENYDEEVKLIDRLSYSDEDFAMSLLKDPKSADFIKSKPYIHWYVDYVKRKTKKENS